MSESSPDEIASKRKDFICGVVEGFYGRPWTTEQRKDLFQKLNKWSMDMYVYAPKDDYKHRAYWRDLYTVEEAEHLTSLISAAKDQGIIFCYALSPGLDITYSSQKEITALKRKLEQVSQFGCTCFALLFDDIEPEMSEADKQIFQSFAHAQVSITNEIHQHLRWPRFLVCPTQYCATRAQPTVSASEYLNTLGTKLSLQIDIMWTGPKVISKTLTVECIEEITQVLRRPPVIWDNLHANDYDQNRIFLGPYCGRSPELIPVLRGVLTNPNCEYNANLPAIRTLSRWALCTRHAPKHMESVSWDIKLESEGQQGVCDDEPPLALNDDVYHPRQALRMAINEWLPEFSIQKVSQGPVIKPQPPTVAPVPIIPIVPSVNTCMTATCPSHTATQATAAMPPIPTVPSSRLRALADVTAVTDSGSTTRVSPVECVNPVANPVMNSLVSATQVVVNDSIPNPIIPLANSHLALPPEIPVSTLPVPILGLKGITHKNGDEMMLEKETHSPISNDISESQETSSGEVKKDKPDMVDDGDIVVDEKEDGMQNGVMSIGETPPRESPAREANPGQDLDTLDVDPQTDVNMNDALSENGSMQVEPSNSPLSTDMMVEASDAADCIDESREEPPSAAEELTVDDLLLLCELFYLPFEHGGRALRLLQDFHWLVTHASRAAALQGNKPECGEWRRRRCRFAWWTARARRLTRRLQRAANQELASELLPYCCSLLSALSHLQGFVAWCELGKFPSNIAANIQGSYTWFSKGWREAFESGAQEPWVFRGGLTSELRRLLPVDGGAGERAPAAAAALPPLLRPYCLADEDEVRALCHKTCRDGGDCTELFPADLQSLPADRLVAPFLTFVPEFCMLLEDDTDCDVIDPEGDPEAPPKMPDLARVKPKVVGFACGAYDVKDFYKKMEVAWIPEMCRKYPKELLEREDLSLTAKEYISYFHNWSAVPAPTAVTGALVYCGTLTREHAPAVFAGLLAALTATGVTGVHTCISSADHYSRDYYSKMGFVETASDAASGRVYLGRTF